MGTSVSGDDRRATVLGGLTTVLWPAILVLNVLLIAQVLAVVFDSGIVVDIPVFGSYRSFTLLMAILYGISQSVLAILGEHQRRWFGRAFLGIIVSVAIAGEAGLAFFRALILSEGAIEMAPTVWDSVIAQAGPALAAVIAAVVGITEVYLAKHAFPNFVEPVLSGLGRGIWRAGRRVWRSLMGILSVVGCSLLWAFFGFHTEHPIRLPGAIANLSRQLDEISTIVERLKPRLRLLLGNPTSPARIPDSKELPDLGATERTIIELSQRWRNERDSVLAGMHEVRATSDREVARERLGKISREFHDMARDLRDEVAQLQRDVRSQVADLESVKGGIDLIQSRCAGLANGIGSSRADVLQLQSLEKGVTSLAKDIDAVLRGDSKDPAVLATAQVAEMARIRSDARNKNEGSKRQRALWVVDHAQKDVQHVLQPGIGRGHDSVEALMEEISGLDEEWKMLDRYLTSGHPDDVRRMQIRAETNTERVAATTEAIRDEVMALGSQLKALEIALRPTPWWIAVVRFLASRLTRKSRTPGAAGREAANSPMRIVALEDAARGSSLDVVSVRTSTSPTARDTEASE